MNDISWICISFVFKIFTTSKYIYLYMCPPFIHVDNCTRLVKTNLNQV